MALRGPKGADLRTQFANLQRPEPPDRLTPEGQAIWRETVAEIRGGWFRGAENLLEAYCRTVTVERALSARLDALAPGSEAYLALAVARRAEVTTLVKLAAALRISPQSSRDRYSVPRTDAPASMRKPWEIPSRSKSEELIG